MTDAYIYDAIRTPRGKGRADGSLHEVTALRLSADTLNALKARNGAAADAVEDVIWGNVTQVGEQGGCLARSAVLLSDLGESVPGLVDQPLLRQRARGGEPRRQPGARRRRRRLHRRRRRDDEPGADGLGRRGDRRRPLARDEELLRAAGHLAPTSSPPSSASPATTATPRRREPEARGAGLGARAASRGRSCRSRTSTACRSSSATSTCGPGTDMQSLGALKPSFKDMGETMPGFDAVAILKYPHLERINHVHHAGNSSRHRRRRGGGADRLEGLRRDARADAARPRSGRRPRSAPTRRSC